MESSTPCAHHTQRLTLTSAVCAAWQLKHQNKELLEERQKLQERIAYYEKETNPEAEAVAFLESLRDIFVEASFPTNSCRYKYFILLRC